MGFGGFVDGLTVAFRVLEEPSHAGDDPGWGGYLGGI